MTKACNRSWAAAVPLGIFAVVFAPPGALLPTAVCLRTRRLPRTAIPMAMIPIAAVEMGAVEMAEMVEAKALAESRRTPAMLGQRAITLRSVHAL